MSNHSKKEFLVSKIKHVSDLSIVINQDECFCPIMGNYVNCSFANVFKLIPVQKGNYANNDINFDTLSAQALTKKKSSLFYGLSILENAGQLRHFEYSEQEKRFLTIDVENIKTWKAPELKKIRYLNVTILIFLVILMLEYNLSILNVSQKSELASFLPEGIDRPRETGKKESAYNQYAKKYSSSYITLSGRIIKEEEIQQKRNIEMYGSIFEDRDDITLLRNNEQEKDNVNKKMKEQTSGTKKIDWMILKKAQAEKSFENFSNEEIEFLLRSKITKDVKCMGSRESMIRALVEFKYRNSHSKNERKFSINQAALKKIRNRENLLRKKYPTEVEIRKTLFLEMLKKHTGDESLQYYFEEYRFLNDELFETAANRSAMPQFYDFICYTYCVLVMESTISSLVIKNENPLFEIYGEFIPENYDVYWEKRDRNKIKRAMTLFFEAIKKENPELKKILLPRGNVIPQLIWGLAKPIQNEELNQKLQHENDFLFLLLDNKFPHDPKIQLLKENIYTIRKNFKEHYSKQSLFLYLEEEKVNKQLKRLEKLD